MAASGEFVEHTTAMAVEEKAKLQKHFSRFDMLFFLICTLVGVDTLGQVSSYGAQGFTWLIFLGIFFFIPYALLTAEIGSAFTEEGGPYVWTKLAWGRFLACLNGVLYWISNPIWMGGLLTITAIETFSTFFTTLDNRVLFYGFGAAVHLVRHRRRDPVLRHRQVDPDDRRMVADRSCSASSR